MDREQARLKREERKVKAKKEREKRRIEEEKKQQMEREFQENGECCFFAPWWGKLIKIAGMFIFSFWGLYILFLPGIDVTSKIPALLYSLIFFPPLLVDVKHLFFPVADVVVSETGILVQCFYGSPGQLYWEDLIKFDDGNIVDIFGKVGFFVDGFFVQFRDKSEIAKRLNPLKAIYFRLGSLPLFGPPRITVPPSFDSYKFRDAANYFYGEWEKKQRVENLESPKQTAEQKRN